MTTQTWGQKKSKLRSNLTMIQLAYGCFFFILSFLLYLITQCNTRMLLEESHQCRTPTWVECLCANKMRRPAGAGPEERTHNAPSSSCAAELLLLSSRSEIVREHLHGHVVSRSRGQLLTCSAVLSSRPRSSACWVPPFSVTQSCPVTVRELTTLVREWVAHLPSKSTSRAVVHMFLKRIDFTLSQSLEPIHTGSDRSGDMIWRPGHMHQLETEMMLKVYCYCIFLIFVRHRTSLSETQKPKTLQDCHHIESCGTCMEH